MESSSEVVRYEEKGAIAIVTLNRPEKLNTLTNSVIQGVADGIERATASREVRAIVLRGEGRVFTAGYDLVAGEDGGWDSGYDVPSPPRREGAWDPVRDYQFMNRNVERFMKIWHCPKPVIGQVHGFAVGGATDLVLTCDQLIMADDAFIGYAPSRVFGTPTTMLWVYRLGLEHAKQFLLTGEAIDAETAYRIGLVSRVVPAADLAEAVEEYAQKFTHIPGNQLALNKLLINQAFENMGLRTTQMLGTFFDGVTRHTEEAYRWAESFQEKGFRKVIQERDAPWGDYGERKK